jgi:hypothetical protein
MSAWKDTFVRKGYRFPEDVYELAPLGRGPRGGEVDARELGLADPEDVRRVATL